MSEAKLSPAAGSKDYFAVYVKRSRKESGRFLCNVSARDSSHAMRIARDQGFTLPRGSFALRIGRDGYFRALKSAFPLSVL